MTQTDGQLVIIQSNHNENEYYLSVSSTNTQQFLELLRLSTEPDFTSLTTIQPIDWIGSLSDDHLPVLYCSSYSISFEFSRVIVTPTYLKSEKLAEVYKQFTLLYARKYSKLYHVNNRHYADPAKPKFMEGQDIPYAGRVFQEDEVEAAVSSTLDFWLTLGKEGKAFEQELAQYLGIHSCLLVNSGSSANLIAVSVLTSDLLPESKRLNPGDEVITCAAGFPTTVAPIIQNNCVPVFLDNDPITGNVSLSNLEKSFRPGKTKAVILAHALGNPFNIKDVLIFCRQNNLWLIEDNCDSLGSSYSLPLKDAHLLGFHENSPGLYDGSNRIIRWTGTWGDISTQSFYPPHHITMGEGGSVNIVNNPKLKRIAESFRDWGRDCWCPSGQDNSCGKRYEWTLGNLPLGYDHKYIYAHLGYNLKPLDLQAAIGRTQLKRLSMFVESRKNNWQLLRKGLSDLEEFFEFSLPTHATNWDSISGFSWDNSGCKTNCSWFGFLLLLKPNAPFSRAELALYLNHAKIGTRMLFGGNLIKQPAFVKLKLRDPQSFRCVDETVGADRLMNNAIFVGTYPGIGPTEIDFICKKIHDFVYLSLNHE